MTLISFGVGRTGRTQPLCLPFQHLVEPTVVLLRLDGRVDVDTESPPDLRTEPE